MNRPVTLVIRYRKANTYGLHAILAALEASSISEQVDVVIADNLDEVVNAVSSAQVDNSTALVAWSFYSPDFRNAAKELASVRQQTGPAVVLHIAGGVHATAEPAATLQAGFDLVAIGDGEETFLALTNALVRGEPYSHLPGLASLDPDGKLIRNRLPERHELDLYPSFPWRRKLSSPIEITRGCIYACKFCQTPFMFQARFRHRSIDNIRQHVRVMCDRGLKDIRFITPTSLSYGSPDESVNLDAIESLLAGIREELGAEGRIFFGSFPSEVRPEHVTKESLRLLKCYVANDNLIIGAQSGSEQVLKASHRGHGVQPIRDAVRLCLEEGFKPNVDFIFGMPGESHDDALASLDLAEQLSEAGARIHGHTFMPLPGTPWRDAQPEEVDADTLRALKRLMSRGKLYGQWQKQHAIALDLASLRDGRRRSD